MASDFKTMKSSSTREGAQKGTPRPSYLALQGPPSGVAATGSCQARTRCRDAVPETGAQVDSKQIMAIYTPHLTFFFLDRKRPCFGSKTGFNQVLRYMRYT